MTDYLGTISIGISILGSFIAWLVADTKSKSRLGFLEEEIRDIVEKHNEMLETRGKLINSLDVRLSTSDQELSELRRLIERLEESKASREVVDGFRSEISVLRIDMDKRFDRIERLIEDRK